MSTMLTRQDLAKKVHDFVREGFRPRFGEPAGRFESGPLWQRLTDVGSELWLDSGNLEEISSIWTRQFTSLTTNNTLLNREVQTGTYDQTISQAARLLAEFELSEAERILEIAFVLNARHGLKLVEGFDAFVSVEEHTDLAGDVELAVHYARRYHAICPERFIVKIPFTPAGLLATRRLSDEGITVNHTLGFAARQNYVIARIGRPAFVNVFMGRLNSFVADNDLGDGSYVGERATLASQAAVGELRRSHHVPSRQIGASFREPGQVRDLAGIDVMTIPPKVAGGFLKLGLSPDDLADRTAEEYEPGLKAGLDPSEVRLETLWEIDEKLVAAVDALDRQDLGTLSPRGLVTFFADHGCEDFLVDWTDQQVAASRAEGKIPRLAHWAQPLKSRRIGLDALMNLAGLNSFTADQQAMDQRVREVLAKAGK